MNLNRTNIVLACMLLVVALLTGFTRVDYSQPNIEVLPDMKYTPAWMAYAENPVFANGRTLQSPVAGTIPRGAMPIHFLATKEDAIRAGEELKNPYDAMEDNKVLCEASVTRGGDTYRVFCISCHGATGAGDGPVPKRGFPPPPSLLTGKSVQMKDGQLFHILTYGQGSMSDFAGQLSPERRWDVINFIRSLQPSTDASDIQDIDDGEVRSETTTPSKDNPSNSANRSSVEDKP